MNKAMKVIIIIGVTVVILLTGAGVVIGNMLYRLALDPHSNKEAVFSASTNQIEDVAAIMPEESYVPREEAVDWMKSLATDEIVQSEDGLQLHGYQVKNEEASHKWAILFHGYMSSGEGMSRTGLTFYEEGYNVLLPDARGHGQSEGDYIGMGWHERLDALLWIHKIVEEDPDAEIVLYGISMGGATVMMISGEELPYNVKVIVEDCGYSSVWGEFSYQLNTLFHLPEFPLMHISSLITKSRAGYYLGEASAIDQVSKSNTPIFFVHGDSDTFVPSFMVDDVYEAAQVEKEKLIVEGAGHGMASAVLGDEYWVKVFAFVDRFVESP